MIRTCVLASSLLLAAAAAACAASSPYGSLDQGFPGPSHGTNAGNDGGTTATGADASGGVSGDDAGDDGGGGLVDGGVYLGDAAIPTNCTIGPAGAIAVIPLETMAPGLACGACHLAVGKPLYIAGTVDPTYHEPDLCLGVSGLQIEIVDNSGATHTLPVDSSGNFLDQNVLALYPAPWKVAVLNGSARRDMVGTVTSGDCNSCHTAAGASNAPGRIIPPDPSGGDGG